MYLALYSVALPNWLHAVCIRIIVSSAYKFSRDRSPVAVTVDGCVQLLHQLPALALLKRELRRTGSNPGAAALTALAVLAAESADGQPMRLTGLAERLQIDPSVASRQVAHLVDIGAVQRVADQQDGRVHRLQVTAAGQAELRRARQETARAVADQLQDWDEFDLQQLTELLARLRFDLSRRPDALPSPVAAG